ncbi:MAG: hypothetical protein AABY93_14770 [Bacteroidota bacterium]
MKTNHLILLFFLLLFLINYYDLFYILDPVRQIGKEPTFGTYVIYNFSFRLVFYGSKFFSLALLLYGSSMLWNLKLNDESSSFGKIFKIVVTLEYIYLLAKTCKIIYFQFIHTSYTFDDYINFFPLSFYSPTSQNGYLLNQMSKDFSAFDFVYIICMILGVRNIYDISSTKSVLFVLQSYILPLILWITFLNFIGII